jgi:Zn ribbon nucleic-acid-binding protein
MAVRFIQGVTCPACEENTMRVPEPTNALSRYAEAYICSECGTLEALGGFFWMRECLQRGYKLNAAGIDIFTKSIKNSKLQKSKLDR